MVFKAQIADLIGRMVSAPYIGFVKRSITHFWAISAINLYYIIPPRAL
jgi:hypothetical protein